MIPGRALLELLAWGMFNQLSEDGAAGVHPPLFRTRNSPSFGPKRHFEFQIVPATALAIHLRYRDLAALREI
jgi:hypothetical protein